MTSPTDATMNDRPAYTGGEVLQGFGLHNAGRFYTVVGTRPHARRPYKLERHLDGKCFWTDARFTREVEGR